MWYQGKWFENRQDIKIFYTASQYDKISGSLGVILLYLGWCSCILQYLCWCSCILLYLGRCSCILLYLDWYSYISLFVFTFIFYFLIGFFSAVTGQASKNNKSDERVNCCYLIGGNEHFVAVLFSKQSKEAWHSPPPATLIPAFSWFVLLSGFKHSAALKRMLSVKANFIGC